MTGVATTSNWSKDTALSFSNTYDKPANVTLDANTKKLTWDESKGISNDAEVDVAGYEIWAKYTDDEEKAKEMKVIYDELVEAGAIDLSDDELDAVAGGRMGWGKIADVTDDYGNRF